MPHLPRNHDGKQNAAHTADKTCGDCHRELSVPYLLTVISHSIRVKKIGGRLRDFIQNSIKSAVDKTAEHTAPEYHKHQAR